MHRTLQPDVVRPSIPPVQCRDPVSIHSPDVVRHLQIVGIDDWAWPTTSAPSWWIWSVVVSLMCYPGGTADSLARWLAARPAIKVISRDRHGPYADGVRRGAPQAKEVAD